jgi:ArsR family transcriptional regulator
MPIRKSSAACCAPVLAGRLETKQADELAGIFRALGDPGRLRLLSFLAAQPDGEACVCNLTEPLGLSQPTVSHHLKVLTEAGLLERERRATWIFYRLRLERLGELCAALMPPKRLASSMQRRAASADRRFDS